MTAMLRKRLLRIVSILLAAAVVMACFTSCGDDKGKDRTTVTFRIMSWNEDFRNLVETYFIPRHSALMKNVRLEWVTDEINVYRSSVQRRLSEGEHIDLFLGTNRWLLSLPPMKISRLSRKSV